MAKFTTDFSMYKNVQGIYCITNLVNNKRYIGSAINLHERILQHYSELTKRKHFNTHLQRSWLKYGEDNFDVEILETFTSISYKDLLKIEDKYIQEYDLLNKTKGFNKRLNNSFPQLSKKSIMVRKQKHNLTKIKIMLFNKDTGVFFREFDSITETALFLNDQTTNISKARDVLTRSVKGYVIISSNNYNKNFCYKNRRVLK